MTRDRLPAGEIERARRDLHVSVRPERRLSAFTTAELSRRRRELEDAADTISAGQPEHAGLCRALEAVLAEQESRAALAARIGRPR
jgi:hypothetical protein